MGSWWLRCRSCALVREAGSMDYACTACGGELVVEYAASRATVTTGAPGLWRWAQRLPIQDLDQAVTLGEGATPLIPLGKEASQALGVGAVAVKCEHLGPTGSFKDRIAAVAVTLAVERGLTGLAGTSSGNGGAAAAAYCARAGLTLTVFSLSDVAPQKLLQIRALGGRVLLVEGIGHDAASTQTAATTIATRAAASGVFPFLTGGRYSPEAMEGATTIAYEIAQDAPSTTVVYCPVGGGGLVSALGRGFQAHAPSVRIVAVQPTGCATLRRGLAGDFSGLPDQVTTGVSGLQVAVLFDGPGAVQAVRESGGHLTEVSDEQIDEAQRLFARDDGLLVEPAGATAFAGALADQRNGRLKPTDRVVLIATGAGWKDTAALKRIVADIGEPGRGHTDVPVIRADQIEEVLRERK